jgi:hypothetical protein
MKKLFAALALSLMAATGAAAQSVAGEWDAAMNTPGGPRPFKIMFVQNGEVLSGTVKRPTGDVPLQGTIRGTEVKFTYVIAYNGSPITMSATATLNGSDMKGQIDIAGQMQEELTAKRVAAAPKP